MADRGPRELDVVGFAERVLAMLDQGAFVATYKYAVLIGLLDLCCERADKEGQPPDFVTTKQLAEAIARLYWRQSLPFPMTGVPLRQNSDKDARVLTLLRKYREDGAAPPTWFEALQDPGFRSLLREVEWTLVQMPLPKLQRFGKQEERFLYEIAWRDDIQRAEWANERDFDNRIRFSGDAARHLVILDGLLRPLVMERWTRHVAKLNRLQEDRLREFLFDYDRSVLTGLHQPLAELQAGRCFYCGARLAPRSTQVDHFIPWSRHPDDGLDNLVAADTTCNGNKRDFLPGHAHVERWAARLRERSEELDSISGKLQWPRHRDHTLSLVRSTMLGGRSELRLWSARDTFEISNRERLRELLVAL